MYNEHSKNHDIHCEVESCAYNTCECGCSAATIDVGPTNACSCTETCCATFKKR